MQIYGIDVSKNHLDIYSENQDKKQFTKRIKNSYKAISKFITRVEPEDIICAEYTGIYSNLLLQLCSHSEVKISLISGYDLKHSLGNRKGKSDEIDAKRIWEYANRFNDKLEFKTPDSQIMQEIKALYNLRKQLVKAIKPLLTAHTGNKSNPSNSIAEYRIRMQVVDNLKQQVKNVEKQIHELIEQEEELKTNFDLVTSITGVGTITAIELIITTGNFKRISTARKAAAYAGVCPYPNQSGNLSKKAKIHHRANKRLKSLLHICSKTICIHNKEFKLYRDRKMMEGKHFYLVMNNVANKLLRTIYAVVKNQILFDPNMITLDPRIK